MTPVAVQSDASASPLHFYQTRIGVFVLATFCCALWGSSYPAIKHGYALLSIAPADTASQLLFAGCRFVLAGVILLGVAIASRRSLIPPSRGWLGQVALLGLTQTAIQYMFFYIGLAHASGVKSSIMNATGVFFSVGLAHFLYADDRISRRKALGCLIGFLGVVVVNLSGGKTLDFDFSLLGEGSVILAAFIFAAATIYGKRLSHTIDPLVMTGWQLLIGGALLVVAGGMTGGRMLGFGIEAGALLLFMGLTSSITFALWTLLLKHHPVGLIAAFNFLVPVFGVALSAIFLGESFLRWSYLAALVLVSVGIMLVTRPQPRSRDDRIEPANP